MRTQTTWIALACWCALALAGAAAGEEPDAKAQAFRADLYAYLDQLEALSPSMQEVLFDHDERLREAREGIGQLSTEELGLIEQALDRFPYWRSMPALFASSPEATTAFGSASPLATVEPRRNARSATQFRDKWLAVIAKARRIPSEHHPAGFGDRLDRLETDFLALDEAQLRELKMAVVADLPNWSAPLRGEAAPASGGGCSNSFPNGMVCQIRELANDIVGLPAEIVSEVVALFNDIVSFFGDIIPDDLPTEPDDILAAMGIDINDPDWFEDILDALPILSPPCPALGTDIPAIGVVGDIRATLTCQRGIEWIAKLIYDNAPEDIWGVPVKVPFAIVYYPINYVCLCLQEASEVLFDDLQAEHRDLVDERLDVTVSSRASQVSVDAAIADVGDLDGDAAAVETKMDILEAKADDLIDAENDQSQFLLDFQELALKLRIEANLYRGGNDLISLFQLPGSVGGLLEEVQTVLDEVIGERIDAGRDMSRAIEERDEGDFEYGKGEYKEAYKHYRKAYQRAVKEDDDSDG